MAIGELLQRLESWRDEQIAFLAQLVNQDSGTDDRADVNKVGDMLVDQLERLGRAVTRIEQPRFADHLLAEKPWGPRPASAAR